MARQLMHNLFLGSEDDRFRVDFFPGENPVYSTSTLGAVGGRCTVRIVRGLSMHIIIRDLQTKRKWST